MEKKRVYKYDHRISQFWINRIEYGYDDNMTEAESKEVENFLNDVYAKYGIGHWSFPDNIDSGEQYITAQYIVIGKRRWSKE